MNNCQIGNFGADDFGGEVINVVVVYTKEESNQVVASVVRIK